MAPEPPPPPLPPGVCPPPRAPPHPPHPRPCAAAASAAAAGPGMGASPAGRGARARGARGAGGGDGGCREGTAARRWRPPARPRPQARRIPGESLWGVAVGGEAPASPGGAAAATAAGAAELGLVALWCRRLGGGSERPPAAAAARPGSGQAGGWPGGRALAAPCPGPARGVTWTSSPTVRGYCAAAATFDNPAGLPAGTFGLFTSRERRGPPASPAGAPIFCVPARVARSCPSAPGDPPLGLFGGTWRLAAGAGRSQRPGPPGGRGRGCGRRAPTFSVRRPRAARAGCPGKGALPVRHQSRPPRCALGDSRDPLPPCPVTRCPAEATLLSSPRGSCPLQGPGRYGARGRSAPRCLLGPGSRKPSPGVPAGLWRAGWWSPSCARAAGVPRGRGPACHPQPGGAARPWGPPRTCQPRDRGAWTAPGLCQVDVVRSRSQVEGERRVCHKL
jgi:hypothetical protein